MTDQVNNSTDYERSSVNISSFVLVLMAMSVGMLLAVVVLPLWAPNIALSLTGVDPKAYWFLSRATAFVGLGLLWLSMALGLGITNKLAQIWPGGPTAFALHEYTSLLGLAFVIFHALFLLGDHYINFNLLQLLVPFSTQAYQPFWVGLGQTGFYLGLIVTLSFYIPQANRAKSMAWFALLHLSILCGRGHSRPGNRHRSQCLLGAVVLLAHRGQPADLVYLPSPFQICSVGAGGQTSDDARPVPDKGTG